MFGLRDVCIYCSLVWMGFLNDCWLGLKRLYGKELASWVRFVCDRDGLVGWLGDGVWLRRGVQWYLLSVCLEGRVG